MDSSSIVVTSFESPPKISDRNKMSLDVETTRKREFQPLKQHFRGGTYLATPDYSSCSCGHCKFGDFQKKSQVLALVSSWRLTQQEGREMPSSHRLMPNLASPRENEDKPGVDNMLHKDIKHFLAVPLRGGFSNPIQVPQLLISHLSPHPREKHDKPFFKISFSVALVAISSSHVSDRL